MKKRLSERYFTIVEKALSDITEEEASAIALNFVPEDDSQLASLLTLLSFFDNKNDIETAVKRTNFKHTRDIKSLIRDILRESRKTRHYPNHILSALIEKYYEAFDITVEILEEIHSHYLFDALITDANKYKSLIALIEQITELADDKRFPLGKSLFAKISDVFYKSEFKFMLFKDNEWQREKYTLVVRPIELIIFLKLKQKNGWEFEDILTLSEDEILKEPEFLYALLFVYNKQPYELLNTSNEWLKKSAIHAMAK